MDEPPTERAGGRKRKRPRDTPAERAALQPAELPAHGDLAARGGQLSVDQPGQPRIHAQSFRDCAAYFEEVIGGSAETPWQRSRSAGALMPASRRAQNEAGRSAGDRTSTLRHQRSKRPRFDDLSLAEQHMPSDGGTPGGTELFRLAEVRAIPMTLAGVG